MAKTIVKKNDEILVDETLDRVLVALNGLRTDLAAELGNESDEKGDFAKSPLTCNPIKKKELKAVAEWIKSAFKADRSESGVGREAKADLDTLQVVYLVARRDWPNAKVSTLRNIVVNTYNNRYSSGKPEFMIDSAYVASQVKKHGWDQLPVPAADAKLPVVAGSETAAS